MSVVPFGKYKGRPVEDMLADADYMAWLGSQPWFREKFAHLGRAIEDELSRTPVHNRLQGLFLSPLYCAAFGRCANPRALNELEAKVKATFARELQRGEDKVTEAKEKAPKYPEGHQYRDYYQQQVIDWGDGLAEMRASELEWLATSAFEMKGADVVIALTVRLKGLWDTSYGKPEVYTNAETWRARVEIKPVVADDYPAVLRQMARHQTQYLFVGEYAGEGVTENQFVEIFARSGIGVVFKHTVDVRVAA